MAVGGNRASVMRLVAAQGLRLAGAGALLVLVLTPAWMGLTAHLLYGLAALHLITFAVAAAAAAVVAALIASLLRAWNASSTRTPPAVVLRNS